MRILLNEFINMHSLCLYFIYWGFLKDSISCIVFLVSFLQNKILQSCAKSFGISRWRLMNWIFWKMNLGIMVRCIFHFIRWNQWFKIRFIIFSCFFCFCQTNVILFISFKFNMSIVFLLVFEFLIFWVNFQLVWRLSKLKIGHL